MLARFSYFLTIDAALLAFVAGPAFEAGATSFSVEYSLFGVGMLISVIWIYFGWMDNISPWFIGTKRGSLTTCSKEGSVAAFCQKVWKKSTTPLER